MERDFKYVVLKFDERRGELYDANHQEILIDHDLLYFETTDDISVDIPRTAAKIRSKVFT